MHELGVDAVTGGLALDQGRVAFPARGEGSGQRLGAISAVDGNDGEMALRTLLRGRAPLLLAVRLPGPFTQKLVLA